MKYSKMKQIFGLLFLVFSINGMCQTKPVDFGEIEWSVTQVKNTLPYDHPKFLGGNDYESWTYGLNETTGSIMPTTIIVANHDQSGTIISKETVEIPSIGFTPGSLIGVFDMGDRFVFLTKAAAKKVGKNNLYALVYGKEENKFILSKNIVNIPIEKVNNQGFINASVSSDGRNLGVWIDHPFVKKSKQKVSALVFDANLELVWSNTQTLEFDSKRAYHEKMFMANDGTMYIVKKTDVSTKKTQAYLLNVNQDKIQSIQISEEKFFPTDFAFATVNGEDKIIGYYTEPQRTTVSISTQEGVAAIGTFLLDAKSGTLQETMEFSSPIFNVEVTDVLEDNGKAYLFGQEFTYESEIIPGTSPMQFKKTYTYGIISAALFESDSIVYATASFDQNYSFNSEQNKGSFLPYLNKGKPFIIVRMPQYGKNLSLLRVDDKGMTSANLMMPKILLEINAEDLEYQVEVFPKDISRLSSDTIFFYGETYEDALFGKATLVP